MVTLYHFTSEIFIDKIKRKGLIEGKTPYLENGKVKFHILNQWLTKNPDVIAQTWAAPISITYRRDDYRIRVTIPRNMEKNIFSMEQIIEELGGAAIPHFNAVPEATKDWFCYKGIIPKSWITQIRRVRNG